LITSTQANIRNILGALGLGTIDKTLHTLTCVNCNITESATVSDKSSGWGGSDWRDSASFSKFSTSWEGGGRKEPSIISSSCNQCGETPKAKSRFTG
jgi:hypothetical protein